MKKRFIIGAFLIGIILCLVGASFFYYSIRSPLEKQYEKAKNFALNEVESIDSVSHYFGTEAYFVVEGTDELGTKVIVWIDDDFEKSYIRKKEEGITIDEALRIFSEEFAAKKVRSIQLGMEKNLPIYEIIYETDESTYGYYYMTFTDGSFLKRYQLRKD